MPGTYQHPPERQRAVAAIEQECLKFRDWAVENKISKNVRVGRLKRGWEAASRSETTTSESGYYQTTTVTQLVVMADGSATIVGSQAALDCMTVDDIEKRKREYLRS